jgi:CheY-like chemotaxis protein
MLAFSGRGKFVVEPVDLSELMVDIGALARASVPRTIAIEYHLAPSLPLVNTDLSQMQQVVMNLLANSAEAIGSAPGGITVATRVTRVGVDPPHDRLTGMAVPAGSYVCLEVTDTGPGLTEASERHLFDPIFTTRGGRRGLGLPAVAGIVRGHHGAVVVQSPPSGGFTVQVLLPCPSSPQLGDSRRLTPRPATSGTYRGTGTVLVVDDEEMVREVARIALVQAGFTVLTAKDGVDGVETVRTRGDELVAVILDLTMPRLDGRAAYAKIRTERPGLPVFIISGYSREEASERLAATGIAGFVQKPFNPPDLVTALRQTLEPRTRG